MPYVSPLQSNAVTFASGVLPNLVSLYSQVTGFIGTGGMPVDGSTVRIQTSKIYPDSYDFSPLNASFKYLRSDTLYLNNPAGISDLLAASSLATPIGGSSPIFYSEFEMPASPGAYLYLIWDLRTSIATGLCYGASIEEVCCGCAPCEVCSLIRIDNTANATECVVDIIGGVCGDTPGSTWTQAVPAGEYFEICVSPNVTIEIVSGDDPVIETLQCGCTYCPEGYCNQWVFSANDSLGVGADFDYIDCSGTPTSIHIPAPSSVILCVAQNTTPVLTSGQGDVILFRRCVNPADC